MLKRKVSDLLSIGNAHIKRTALDQLLKRLEKMPKQGSAVNHKLLIRMSVFLCEFPALPLVSSGNNWRIEIGEKLLRMVPRKRESHG